VEDADRLRHGRRFPEGDRLKPTNPTHAIAVGFSRERHRAETAQPAPDAGAEAAKSACAGTDNMAEEDTFSETVDHGINLGL
jgi:hypothetical protein